MLPSGPGALFGSALVITSYNPLLQPDATVCAGSYYGSVGRHNFFWVNHNDGCAQYLSSRDSGLSDDQHTIIQIQKRDNMDLFWLEREAVEQTLFPAVQDELSDFLDQLVSSLIPTVLESQIPMHGPSTAAVEVLERSLNTALVRIDPERIQFLDIPLPSLWKGSLLSRSPLTFLPVPSSSVKRVQEILRRVKFDPVIASIVNNVSIPQLKNDVRFLTGEDEKSGIQSRHSFSDGILVAAEWIKDRMSDTGAHCELKNFLPGFGPNIIWCGSTISQQLILLMVIVPVAHIRHPLILRKLSCSVHTMIAAAPLEVRGLQVQTTMAVVQCPFLG